ncbi:unnamed protein product [Rhizoctonia solani]|uniref:Uncharacterized protein n=1 Tax=Rhizoctonia solani TaxID=456999 RepID=A0A8H3CYC9_9AGAM|nr:unnamed protein product [Rhizoctonia solani]
MVELKDGHKYRVVNKVNHRVLSVSHDDKSPGGWLAIQDYDNSDYENVFKVRSCPGGTWKFTMIDNPNMCIGINETISGDDLSMLRIVKDGENDVHTEWSVDHGDGPRQFAIHTRTERGDFCWSVPDSARAGAVVGLVSREDHLSQQWTFAIPVDK